MRTMGLLDNIVGRRKKETTVNVTNPQPVAQQGVQPQPPQSFDTKFIDGVTQKMTALENDINKLNMGLESLKRSMSEMKTDLDTIRENVRLVVSLYEMVSKEFNPFMDTTPEEIKQITDSLKEDIEELGKLVSSAISDLRELYGTPDIDSIISDVEREGSKDDQ